MRLCGEEELLGHLGVILYENLGEEFPDVLGSILGALKSIVVSLGVDRMTPPIRDLLPRLTPILKNTNEKVTENLIELVGRIAALGPQHVAAKFVFSSFTHTFVFKLTPSPPLFTENGCAYVLICLKCCDHRECPFAVRL